MSKPTITKNWLGGMISVTGMSLLFALIIVKAMLEGLGANKDFVFKLVVGFVTVGIAIIAVGVVISFRARNKEISSG